MWYLSFVICRNQQEDAVLGRSRGRQRSSSSHATSQSNARSGSRSLSRSLSRSRSRGGRARRSSLAAAIVSDVDEKVPWVPPSGMCRHD